VAQQYRAYAFLAQEAGNAQIAAWGYLQAAWVCDDLKSKARTAAVACRRDVLQQMDELQAKNMSYTQDADTDFVFRLDLLRRTGQFDVVIQDVDSLGPKRLDSPLAEIASYQRQLAEARDARCHTVADALPDGE